MNDNRLASPGSPAEPPRSRHAGIDLLRGIAIVLVVIHHTALRIPLEKGVLATVAPDWLLSGLQDNGFESVFLFFVISGFLITSNSLARWGRLAAIDARAFWRRRAARILPCLAILVAVLAVLDVAGVPHYVIDGTGQTLPRAVLAALGLHIGWYEAKTGYLPAGWDVLWSLSIEEVFYLAFPVVCLLLTRTRLLVAALLVLALSQPVAAFGWLRSFGRLSYEIYLTHMFVVWLVVDRFQAAGGDLRLGFAWFVPALLGSWALGWGVARLVSEPAMRVVLRARAPQAGANAGARVSEVSA
jgi:peptidoglycan/LPS O-acetylase OafA/YrhL